MKHLKYHLSGPLIFKQPRGRQLALPEAAGSQRGTYTGGWRRALHMPSVENDDFLTISLQV